MPKHDHVGPGDQTGFPRRVVIVLVPIAAEPHHEQIIIIAEPRLSQRLPLQGTAVADQDIVKADPLGHGHHAFEEGGRLGPHKLLGQAAATDALRAHRRACATRLDLASFHLYETRIRS